MGLRIVPTAAVIVCLLTGPLHAGEGDATPWPSVPWARCSAIPTRIRTCDAPPPRR